jgi:hypothetical protein
VEIDIVWAAGLLEGEGSFFIKTGTHLPMVACQMTDEDVIQRLGGIFGGPLFSPAKQAEHHKQSWKWQVTGKLAAHVMRTVRPHMGLRRTEAIDKALVVWDARQAEIAAVAHLGQRAAEYYRTMPKPSLRGAAAQFGVSYETVRAHLARTKAV